MTSEFLRKPTSFAQARLLGVITHPHITVKKVRRDCKPISNWGPDTADREFDGVLSGPEISLAQLSRAQHLAPAFPFSGEQARQSQDALQPKLVHTIQDTVIKDTQICHSVFTVHFNYLHRVQSEQQNKYY